MHVIRWAIQMGCFIKTEKCFYVVNNNTLYKIIIQNYSTSVEYQ